MIVGLLVALPMSALSSRAAPGRWLRARGVLLTPEELRQPPVLARAQRHAQAFAAVVGVTDAVVDGRVHQNVIRALPMRAAATGLKSEALLSRVEHAVNFGPQALDAVQRHRLLSDAQALRALRTEVLLRRAHPDWWRPATRRVHPDAPRASTLRGTALAGTR